MVERQEEPEGKVARTAKKRARTAEKAGNARAA